MNKGSSLHIGINEVSTAHYLKKATLCSPEHDARAMRSIAETEGYSSISFLLNENATKQNFLMALSDYSRELTAGDTFLLTFSGHGGQVEDTNFDEEDGKDERWCFYDGYLLDDDLAPKWREFKAGVRIVVVSSSCHSRTALKPHASGLSIGKAHKFSDWKQRPLIRAEPYSYPKDSEIHASILHLSACSDEQQARDGDYFSVFTDLLLKHWDRGKFEGNYQDLAAKINREAGYLQNSGIAILGNNCQSLINSRPFKLLTP